jgi:hypothetical protein
MLIEIVGNRTNGPSRPRGLVLCDPRDTNGWALCIFVPDVQRDVPEMRFFSTQGLEHVTNAPEAFALQLITPLQAERKYSDLLDLARTLLPKAVGSLQDLGGEEDSSTMPFELPPDEPLSEPHDGAPAEPEARLYDMMLQGATLAMNGLARMGTLWKSMVKDIAISPRAMSWVTQPVPAPSPAPRTVTIPRGPVTVEIIAPMPPRRGPRIVRRRRSS